jgi:hypothetical protein
MLFKINSSNSTSFSVNLALIYHLLALNARPSDVSARMTQVPSGLLGRNDLDAIFPSEL